MIRRSEYQIVRTAEIFLHHTMSKDHTSTDLPKYTKQFPVFFSFSPALGMNYSEIRLIVLYLAFFFLSHINPLFLK